MKESNKMKQSIKTVIAFAVGTAIAAGAAESARADLQYIDKTGAPATVQSYTAVEESDYIWSTGWYAVTNNVTVDGREAEQGCSPAPAPVLGAWPMPPPVILFHS